jgi:hypothetical protein
MANEEFSPSEIEQLRRVFQEAALNDFPNPDRLGCPSDKTVLKAIAAKTLPLSDPAWQHTARCSPCFREVKAFEVELKGRPDAWKLAAAIAAVVLIAVALFFLRDRLLIRPAATYETATLDLRDYVVFRGEGEKPGEGKRPLSLGRARLTLKVLLPIGAEEGRYEYKLLNDGLQTVESGFGDAKLDNRSTTLTAKLNTERLPVGLYSLWMRQGEFGWRSYQIEIH